MYNKIIELALSENEAKKNIAYSLILSHFDCTPKEAWTEINYIIPKYMAPRPDVKLKCFGGETLTFSATSIHVDARIETLSLLMKSGVKSDGIYRSLENYGFFIKIGDVYKTTIWTNIDLYDLPPECIFAGRYTKKKIIAHFKNDKIKDEKHYGGYFHLSQLREVGFPEELYNKFDTALKARIEHKKLIAEGKKLKQIKILQVGYVPRCYYRDMEKLKLKYNFYIDRYTEYKNNLPFKDYDVVIHDRAIDVGIPNVIITHYDSIKGPNVFRRIDESTIKYIRTLSTTSTED